MNTINTQTVSFNDFAKLELKVGTVIFAEGVEGSEKLIKLQVDLDEDNPRQILAGMKQWYKPEDLVGKQVIVVANLEPKKIMGMESQGMILAAGDEEPILLTVFKQVPSGSKVK